MTTRAATTQQKAIVRYRGQPITITFSDVKNLICPLATDQETVVFLKTCDSLQLNPFAGECFLIKYSERDKAAVVIAIDSYLKSAETNDNYNGHEAGIILKDSAGKLEHREGSFLLEEEMDKLVGGWAKVYRKDREKPFYMAVNKAECVRYTRDGNLTQFWTKEKQPMMLRKTALKRALVEAFPSLFAGMMSTAEVAEIPAGEYHEIPEGELPAAYERNGEAYWKLWWVRQKEKGLIEDDVHSILNVSSVKTDWLEKGRTLEEAEDIINDALEKRAKPKVKAELTEAQPAPVIEEPTGDVVEQKEPPSTFIDLIWLKEQLDTLQDKELKAWSNANIVSYLNTITNGQAKSVTSAVALLTKEQAEDFAKRVQTTVEMA